MDKVIKNGSGRSSAQALSSETYLLQVGDHGNHLLS